MYDVWTWLWSRIVGLKWCACLNPCTLITLQTSALTQSFASSELSLSPHFETCFVCKVIYCIGECVYSTLTWLPWTQTNMSLLTAYDPYQCSSFLILSPSFSSLQAKLRPFFEAPKTYPWNSPAMLSQGAIVLTWDGRRASEMHSSQWNSSFQIILLFQVVHLVSILRIPKHWIRFNISIKTHSL